MTSFIALMTRQATLIRSNSEHWWMVNAIPSVPFSFPADSSIKSCIVVPFCQFDWLTNVKVIHHRRQEVVVVPAHGLVPNGRPHLRRPPSLLSGSAGQPKDCEGVAVLAYQLE